MNQSGVRLGGGWLISQRNQLLQCFVGHHQCFVGWKFLDPFIFVNIWCEFGRERFPEVSMIASWL